MLHTSSSEIAQRLFQRFQRLYGDRASMCMKRLEMMIGRYGIGYEQHSGGNSRDQRDAYLITYGDMLRTEGEAPLKTLHGFCRARLGNMFNTVHILPFFPYSSDDGFSVTDYRRVNPDLGGWTEIESMAGDFRLAADLVLNHVSRRSDWFMDYTAGIAPARHYFLDTDPEADLRAVTRPRSTPLLTPVTTRRGKRHVWTTFSADQVDLNFADPDVLFEFMDILLGYFSHGITVFRLDAIAYLWKKIGTSCINLPETHELVKLLRDFAALLSDNLQLLTETNLPHEENASYFGEGDEAHLVYQFSLPPLLLHCLLKGNASILTEWAANLEPPPEGCSYLNFTASHDGVGLRPLEGLIEDNELSAMLDRLRERGGLVSSRSNADGSETPYEVNITYFDALADPHERNSETHRARFLCSQAAMLTLQGIPAVYFNSLLGTGNDRDGVMLSGKARAINRRKWDRRELLAELEKPAGNAARVFEAYRHMLRVRREIPAFSPDAAQRVLDLGPELLAIERESADRGSAVLALLNFTARPLSISLGGRRCALSGKGPWRDALGGETVGAGGSIPLDAYQARWLLR